MNEEPYMVSNTIKYSDGSETVVNYTANPNGPEIEQEVASMVEENNIDPTVEAPVVEEAPAESAPEAPSESEISDAQPADETAA